MSTESKERAAQVTKVVESHLKHNAEGAGLSDDEVVARHPDLMPELGEALRAARMMSLAARIADAHPTMDATLSSSQATAKDKPTKSTEHPTRETSAGNDSHLNDFVVTLPTIAGYRLIREISRGGQAVVYEAVRESTNRKVAIKVLLVGPHASSRDLARFSREVQILASLDHPNIVQVIDRGRTSDQSDYLVMPYIQGLALDTWLGEYYRRNPEGPPPSDPSELLRMFLRICEAVNSAHVRGVVHRDLKPSNIRVDERGEPHILDFGLARTALMGNLEGGPDEVTLTGQFIGSLAYASPEQARGEPNLIDTRTDVYALGVILFQMLTGKFPYRVVGAMRDVLNNIVTAQPIPPSGVLQTREADEIRRRKGTSTGSGSLNAVIDAIVLKALSKRRDDRHQSAGELAKDIVAYLAGKPVSIEPVVTERSKRSLKQLAVALVAIVVLCVSIASVLSQWPQSTPNLASLKPHQGATPPPDALPVNALDGLKVRLPAKSPDDLAERLSKFPGFTNSLGMRMIRIEPGVVILGSSADTPARSPDEPLRPVRLSKSFHIGATEVTQSQWMNVMGYNESVPQGDDLPVVGVSWDFAKEFCKRLSERESRMYRLPSEAEWEYAARASSKGPFATGSDITADEANMVFGHPSSIWPSSSRVPFVAREQPIAVGSFPPNAWGLFDVHGNVWEWTEDRYGPYPTTPGELVDWRGPSTGEFGVLRGGGCKSAPEDARLARRLGSLVTRSGRDAGFRIVAIEPASEKP